MRTSNGLVDHLRCGRLPLSRRQFLGGSLLAGVTAAAGALGAGLVRATPAHTQGKGRRVIVRALGGAYQAAEEKAIFKPFTEATGIEVVPVPATAAQVRAMVESGKVQLDVLDLAESTSQRLDEQGLLERIDYDRMRLTNSSDIQPHARRPTMVGNIYFATALAYNTEVFKPGSHPKSWAEFWDAERFPGPRTLQPLELEFALLADGAPMDRLYPLDVDRAFRSMDRIKKHVVKWWDTGAVSAQLLERREAVLGGIWNGRIQDLIDKGAPLAIEWNQAKRQLQFWSIVKGAPNRENAMRFIDFALQPKVQAALTRYIAYGPTNVQAFKFVRPEDAQKLPSEPEHFKRSFDEDARWWSENSARLTERWQAWLLKG